MDWQPIETAPQGPMILITDGHDWAIVSWDEEEGVWVDSYDGLMTKLREPTHWVLLTLP